MSALTLVPSKSALDSITQSVIDSLPANVAILDRCGVIIAINNAWFQFARANGLKHPEACVGQNYLQTCAKAKSNEPEATAVIRGLSAVLWGQSPYFELEYACHSPNEERWFLMTATPLHSGGDSQVIVCHHNITHRVIAEHEAREATEKLKTAYCMVAHDFRSPLTSIKGSLSLLRSGLVCELPDEAEELISIAEETSDYLIALASDFLDLPKPAGSGVQNSQLEHVKVDTICSAAVNSVSGMAQKREINLIVDAPSDLAVACRPRQIERVIVNLLSNALKFSACGSTVKLTVLAEHSDAVFSVSDKGPGIPEERIPFLFEEFGASTPSTVVKGSGLGLSIVKNLLEANDSQISVRSELNVGTTFEFRLPIVK